MNPPEISRLEAQKLGIFAKESGGPNSHRQVRLQRPPSPALGAPELVLTGALFTWAWQPHLQWRTQPTLVLPLLPQDSSSAKIPFQFCVWIQVSREFVIKKKKKMNLSSFTMILGILVSHIKPPVGKTAVLASKTICKSAFSTATRPEAKVGQRKPGLGGHRFSFGICGDEAGD